MVVLVEVLLVEVLLVLLEVPPLVGAAVTVKTAAKYSKVLRPVCPLCMPRPP